MRELVSGTEIQAIVQARVDDDPRLAGASPAIIVPMPKPTASESITGCNWTIHTLGQIPPDQQAILDDIVEITQHDVNIGGRVKSDIAG
ncbi:MAG: hypothetical protein JWR77_666 [Rhizorhabdus sp.]|nr:hypothetical protein [Rhizorhabdus sp.]